MNTFWLKLAGVAILVIAVIIIGSRFLSSDTAKQAAETTKKQKTYYDVVREDDRRLRAEPNIAASKPQNGIQNGSGKTENAEKQKPKFEELTREQEVQAQKLFEWALTQRKMGRLPGMTYKQMVDTCRKIINQFPESEYAYKAKKMLSDIPESYRRTYNITEDEIIVEN